MAAEDGGAGKSGERIEVLVQEGRTFPPPLSSKAEALHGR
jgi:hypothetical protein